MFCLRFPVLPTMEMVFDYLGICVPSRSPCGDDGGSVQCMCSTLVLSCQTTVVCNAVVVLLDAVSACNERGFDCPIQL